jgi:hypothetical protein
VYRRVHRVAARGHRSLSTEQQSCASSSSLDSCEIVSYAEFNEKSRRFLRVAIFLFVAPVVSQLLYLDNVALIARPSLVYVLVYAPPSFFFHPGVLSHCRFAIIGAEANN